MVGGRSKNLIIPVSAPVLPMTVPMKNLLTNVLDSLNPHTVSACVRFESRAGTAIYSNTTATRKFPSRAGPIPLTASSSARFLKGPLAVRKSRMRTASAGPMPGSSSN